MNAEQLAAMATASMERDFPIARLPRLIGVMSSVLRKPFSLSPAIELAGKVHTNKVYCHEYHERDYSSEELSEHCVAVKKVVVIV